MYVQDPVSFLEHWKCSVVIGSLTSSLCPSPPEWVTFFSTHEKPSSHRSYKQLQSEQRDSQDFTLVKTFSLSYWCGFRCSPGPLTPFWELSFPPTGLAQPWQPVPSPRPQTDNSSHILSLGNLDLRFSSC